MAVAIRVQPYNRSAGAVVEPPGCDVDSDPTNWVETQTGQVPTGPRLQWRFSFGLGVLNSVADAPHGAGT